VTSLQFLLILPWAFSFFLMGHFTLKVFAFNYLKGISLFTFNFWVGFGVLGFLFLGVSILELLSINTVIGILSLSLLGLFYKKDSIKNLSFKTFDQGHLLIILFILTCIISLPAAMTPPLSGSSLEYHLAIPKAISQTGSLNLTTDSFLRSGPLFIHNLNAAAFLLGGEKLMMLHGWVLFVMSGLAVFALARKRLRVASSWIFTALIMSLPVITYSAGSGVIEPKLLGILSLTTFSLFYYARSEKLSWLILSAFFIGISAQTHIIGFFIALAFIGTSALIQKDFGLKKGALHFLIFISAITLFTMPFYAWAYQETGHLLLPFFNDLAGMTGWSEMQQALYQQETLTQSPFMDRSYLNLLFTYPIEMTLKATDWRMTHLSLGPLFLMSLIPCLLLLVKRFPYLSPIAQQYGTLELHVMTFLIFYGLWFFYGMSMEPQNLIPLLPLIMLPAWVMAENLIARSSFTIRGSLITAVFVIMAMQFGISSKLNQPAIALLFKKVTLEDYIEQNIPELTVAEYLKSTMKKDEKVLYTQNGKMNYILGHQGFYAPAVFQEKIPVAFGSSTDIINSALSEKINLWVTENNAMNPKYDSDYNAHKHLRKLIEHGCFKEDAYIEPKPNMSFYVYRFIENCQGQNPYI
jgi:hypothetical protein